MVLTIIALTSDERFIQFIDPSLCKIKETITSGGLRTINLEYKFQDFREDKKVKELFKLGNKLWIQGDLNLTDCLYVVNTSVKEDIFKENSFTLECEEALVELNNAPLVSHLDFTTYPSVFKTRSTNDASGGLEVKIDWNSLNYWFGAYFNIGVVQDCLNSSVQWIPFFGTYNLMNLLRYIEEQTGNVFVTRYEKDPLSNIIHRYLDFLNPINVSKNWELHLEYDFLAEMVSKYYDENWNEIPEDKAWEIIPYTNSHIEPESISETDIIDWATIDAYDTLDPGYTWIEEDENVTDEDTIKHYTIYKNINPDNTQFQITDQKGQILNADGSIYSSGDDNPLIWSCSDIGLTTSNTHALITLSMTGKTTGLTLNNRNYAIIDNPGTSNNPGGKEPQYVTYTNTISENTTTSNKRTNTTIPDDSYFEIYDHVTGQVLFRTCINRSIGTVHPEILDFAFNMDNVVFDVDESDVYTSVAPVLQYNESNGSSNGMTRGNFTDLLTRYKDLEISKGDLVPMIVQKVGVSKSTLEASKAYLGSYVEGSGANYAKRGDGTVDKSNWWIRPYKPQDQAGSSYEFIRATAYWYAPYPKKKGELGVNLTDMQGIDYNLIYGRNDNRNNKGSQIYHKTGTTESSDEDIFAIYNQCALYLKEHCTPKVDLEVDVANLQNGKYNDYSIHDKVYIKIPGTAELITATVTETTKEANDVASNKIKLSNYTTNTVKVITNETIIRSGNINFKYPGSKQVIALLENLDYDSEDPYSIQYPANKLLNFTLYSVKDGQRTFQRIYTKRTDAYGYVKFDVKYNPGDYEFDIQFAGDEEYNETTTTIKVNVAGTIETKTKAKKKTKAKTTKKTKVTKTTYYDKYGRSPDKKKILAIGRPSASGDEGAYDFYGMEFKNLCPHCGKQSLVWGIFWAGENTNYGYFDGTKGSEGGSIEGHIFCTHCDADYSCQGREHVSNGKTLAVTKKRFKSSKSDAYLLKKGKYIYQKKTETVKAKSNASTKNRKIIGSGISNKVKQLALKIVGNKTGYSALRAVAAWMDNNIAYHGYYNFVRSPDEVINRGGGNCCDQTRLMLQLMDAAGCCEFYNLYYCHVTGHVYAIVEAKKSGGRSYVDPASDAFPSWGYVCQGYERGTPTTRYPKLPF